MEALIEKEPTSWIPPELVYVSNQPPVPTVPLYLQRVEIKHLIPNTDANQSKPWPAPEQLIQKVQRAAELEIRIKKLKEFAREDGEATPLEHSENLLREFFSLFSPSRLPEITLTPDGLYYLRIVHGGNKLVIRFLPSNKVHYLIQSSSGYLENTSSFDFFQEQHSAFVKRLVRHE